MNEKDLIIEVKYRDLILLKTDIRYLIINYLYWSDYKFKLNLPVDLLEVSLNNQKFNLLWNDDNND